jgi:zinc finger protein
MAAYATKNPEITANAIDFSKPIDDKDNAAVTSDEVKREAIKFPTQCYACTAEGECRMCVATIPYFKEIIIMAFSCELCGHKSTEIKQGGGISPSATRITFDVKTSEDLNRDVFKSDTTMLAIPEVDLELQPGTLGSMYTTMEGLLDKIITHLNDTNPFGKGDSATNIVFNEFLDKLRSLMAGEKPFTVVLDDPLSNCFIYNPMAPEEDPQIKVEIYERTFDQNEELGINDMNV